MSLLCFSYVNEATTEAVFYTKATILPQLNKEHVRPLGRHLCYNSRYIELAEPCFPALAPLVFSISKKTAILLPRVALFRTRKFSCTRDAKSAVIAPYPLDILASYLSLSSPESNARA